MLCVFNHHHNKKNPDCPILIMNKIMKRVKIGGKKTGLVVKQAWPTSVTLDKSIFLCLNFLIRLKKKKDVARMVVKALSALEVCGLMK